MTLKQYSPPFWMQFLCYLFCTTTVCIKWSALHIATNEVLTINCNIFFFQKMLCFESFLKYHFFKTIFVQSTYLKRSLYLRLFKEIQPNYYHLLYCTLLTVRNRSWSSKVALKLYFPLTFDALFTATYYCLTPSFAKTTHFQNNNCKKFLEFFAIWLVHSKCKIND